MSCTCKHKGDKNGKINYSNMLFIIIFIIIHYFIVKLALTMTIFFGDASISDIFFILLKLIGVIFLQSLLIVFGNVKM